MIYDPFYQNLIDIWDHGGKDGKEGGWAAFYYGIFSRVIKENGFKKCAEVGIGYGFHAKEILDKTDIEKLILVDPMAFYPNDSFADDVMRYGGFDKLVENIKTHLSPHQDRYQWFRKKSLSITNDDIQDESLDAVFIDGDHSYDAVSRDLPFWWRKIRVGGWLLGDDYASCCPGTTKAVDEFARIYNLRIEFLTKGEGSEYATYPIYKFVKK